jgi:drug/metabolite transporter (DMT)-like permease
VYRWCVRRISVTCGIAEWVFVALAGLSFFFARTWGTQNVAQESHIALGLVCLAFSAGIGLATFGLSRGSDLAQTPFILIQVFVGIGAYLGIGSTATQPRLLGGLAMVVALVGAVTAVLAKRDAKESV